MSSIGVISFSNAARAALIVASSIFCSRKDSSVRVQRTTVGATLPSAMRMSAMRPSFTRAGRKTNLRDRLRFACADFAVIGFEIAGRAWQAYAREQFIRPDVHLLIAGMKLRVRQQARAACGDEFEFGVIDEQRGRRIGGGRSVDDVAAERAAILDGNAARLARRRAEQRKLAPHRLVAVP